MRVLAIVHQDDAGPGVFAGAVRRLGGTLDTWRLPDGGQPPRDPRGYDAVMTFGGGMHPDAETEHAWLAREKALLADLVTAEVALLGVCLGAELLAQAVGGEARRAAAPEIGWYGIELTEEGVADQLLAPLAPTFLGLEWHSYECRLPPGAVALARSEHCLQAFRVGGRAWGIQFHAEVTEVDFDAWLDDYRSDDDAVRIGLDVEALRARTRPLMAGWNELGDELCERFLSAATRG